MSNISCENISLKTNNKQNEYILKNINLQIAKNDFVAVLGKSGSGKTTLLNVMVGLLKPSQGRVIVDDQDITNISEKQKTYWRRYDVGYIFQNYGVVNVLNAYDNVRLVLDLSTLYSQTAKRFGLMRRQKTNEIYEEVQKIMERLNIWNLCGKFPHELSGGQQQRLAIARTMVKKPKYIFCDEPTGALDHNTSIEVMNLLLELNLSGSTVIMITHNEQLVKYANRVIHISDGKILETYAHDNWKLKLEVVHLQNLYAKNFVLWSLSFWYTPDFYFTFRKIKAFKGVRW